jgi:hypothetical protein
MKRMWLLLALIPVLSTAALVSAQTPSAQPVPIAACADFNGSDCSPDGARTTCRAGDGTLLFCVCSSGKWVCF